VSSYEDRLWGELVEQHGALLADAPARKLAPAPAPARRRRWVPARRAASLAGAAVAVALAIGAIVIGFASGPSTAAFAVAVSRDGTVTITLRELAGVNGADERLQELGEPIRIIHAERSCRVEPREYDLVRQSAAESRAIAEIEQRNGVTTLVVHPSKIAAGETVVFATRVLEAGPPLALGWAQSAYRGATPPCEAAEE